jgi:putative Mg2+ transporter-C (MgtC) family protein
LYNIPKSGSHLTRKRAHLGNAGKEGFSVRGLTTAASIWMTASIGVLIGVGFYFPALITTLLTLSTLTLLRWLEARVLHRHEVQLYLRQSRQGALHEPALVSILTAHGFSVITQGG